MSNFETALAHLKKGGDIRLDWWRDNLSLAIKNKGEKSQYFYIVDVDRDEPYSIIDLKAEHILSENWILFGKEEDEIEEMNFF